eukprot:Em0005g1045a
MVRRKEVEDQLSMYGIGKDDIKVIKGLIIGKQDSFYITAAITVIPKAEWKPQDLSNNRQLWYKVKSLKDADSFAIHDLDHKMYLEINAQPTLSPISDDKEPSRLWKIAEGGSLKIDDYCFGHLQERSGSNVISIVNDKDEYLTADSKDKSSHSSTWYFEPRGNDGSCVIYDHERKNALHCNEAGITLLPISSDETPYLWKIDQDSKTIVDANNQKLRYDITNKTVIPSSNAQDNSIVIVANKYNEIDVDKWDYFTRDCHSLGLKHGFDQTRLLNTARVMKRKKADLPWEDDDDHIAYRDAAKQDLIGMFYTRAQLHKRACQHKVSYAVEMMISDALILAEKAGFTYDFWDSENKIIKECKLSESFTNLDAYMALTDNILEKILLWCRKPPENTDKSENTETLLKCAMRNVKKKEWTVLLLSRWLAHSGVHLASEKRQRLIAKEVIEDNLEAEIAPFFLSRPSYEDEIRAAAYVYTPNLIQKDSIANLHIALGRYKEEVVSLAASQWKGYNIRVFMSGDYEILCALYGTSGASATSGIPSKQDDILSQENKAKARARYKADPEKKKASVRDSYKADPEKKKASVRDSYKVDPEKKKASVRDSYKVDPEKKKASIRDSYKVDPEKKKASVRDSYKADPEKKKASVRDSYNADIESKQSAKRQRCQEDLKENRAAKRQ